MDLSVQLMLTAVGRLPSAGPFVLAGKIIPIKESNMTAV